MQCHMLVFLVLCVAFTEGFFFSQSKCPIKKYGSSKYITGNPLLVNQDFKDRVDIIETLAKSCKVHVYVKGSYYQLKNPTDQVLISDADLVIGHGFQFELRDESNALLCNKLCLERRPMDLPEVKCFLQGALNRGITWTNSYPSVLSDGTYASNTYGYQTLKTDVQTKCKDQNLKRELMRALRQMAEEEEGEQENNNDNDNDDDDDDKTKK